MAVSHDSDFAELKTGSPATFVSTAGTLAAGSVGNNPNRVLIGFAQFDDGIETLVTMTWDDGGTNQAMTQIGSVSTAGGREQYVFRFLAPTVGAKTLKATWAGTSNQLIFGCVSLFGADQTTGWQNLTSATGTS